MKRLFVSSVLALLALQSPVRSQPTTSYNCPRLVIESGWVNVRDSPNGNVIGRAYEGWWVYETGAIGQWSYIISPIRGYVYTPMLSDCQAWKGSQAPYRSEMADSYHMRITQTPAWGNMSVDARKKYRDALWEQSPYWVHIMDFYTSRGWHIARYSLECRGRCFTKE